MKKILLLLIVSVFIGFSLFKNLPTLPASSTQNSQVPHTDLAFAVLGDIHGNVLRNIEYLLY